jgi:Ca-activated chloride channel homolog
MSGHGKEPITVENVNDLPNVAQKIGSELRNQYILGYRPSDKTHDARWRKIKIKLRAPKGLPITRPAIKTAVP